MIQELRTNVTQALALLRMLQGYFRARERADPLQRRLLDQSIGAAQTQLRLLTKAIPTLLSNLPTAQPLPSTAVQKTLPTVHTVETTTHLATLNVADTRAYMQATQVSEDSLARLKKTGIISITPDTQTYERSRGYVKFSQQLFGAYARRLIAQKNYRLLALTLRKSNMGILFENYVSLLLCTTFFSFFVGVGIYFFFLFMSITIHPPFFVAVSVSLSRALALSWIPLLVPALTYFALTYYPSTEQDGASTGIDRELPFAVIHMSAIAGSGIEPSAIFKIIANSNEYPLLSKEMRKIVNQITIYGYDLVASLNAVAQNTPSQRFADLLAGLSQTITSGGELSTFFAKRSETLLLDYRLEREKFIKTAETFMDLYITLVIAAPMILLLVIIMLQLSNFDFGISSSLLTVLIIGLIALLNVVFLSLLQLKQPVN